MRDYIVKWKDIEENIESHKVVHKVEVFKYLNYGNNGVEVYNEREDILFISYYALYTITTREREK